MRMTDSERVKKLIEKEPYLTNTEIGEKLNINPSSVAVHTSVLFNKKVVNRILKEKENTLLKKKYYLYYIDSKVKPEPVAESVVEPVTESVTEPVTEPVTEQVSRKEELQEEVKTLDGVVDFLVEHLTSKIISKLKTRLAKEISLINVDDLLETKGKINDVTEYTTQKNEVSNSTKKTILIAGLLPQQAGLIEAEFGTVFNLKFWKDESVKQLRNSIKNCDLVLTFTSKIGHHVEETILSEGKEIIRVPGGMTSLRDTLTKIYVGE